MVVLRVIIYDTVFFFNQKTAYEMRISDWSSDVCSSDLFDQLLDETARREFYEGLREAPAPFTTDNCAATFGHIWMNRRDLYLRGIATVFSKLDRRFRSHDGFKIGARLDRKSVG